MTTPTVDVDQLRRQFPEEVARYFDAVVDDRFTSDLKIFQIQSTSDLENAQKVYDWHKAGKTAIVVYDSQLYLFYSETTTNAYWSVPNEAAYDTASDTWLRRDSLQFAISSSEVTAITTMTLTLWNFKVLRPDKNYWTPYTPQYDWSPATKKYVDDTASWKVSDTAYWAGWDGDTTHAPSKNAVYDKIESLSVVPSWWNNWDVLTNVSWTPTWSAPTWWVSMSTITVTLASANRSSKEITVSATGVTASNTVIVSPAPANINDYASNSVYCYSQSSWSLTFKCNTEPDVDIVVNVLILS